MNFIKVPNLPEKKVRAIVAWDCEAVQKIQAEILIPTMPVKSLPYPLSLHADLQLHHLGGRLFLSCPEAYDYYSEKLRPFGACVLKGESILACNYPQDTAYNIARVGNLAFHNTKYTELAAKKHFSNNGIQLVHVNQGYAKCQTAICSENAIITSDAGIYKAAVNAGLDVLLIEPGHIELCGYNYGFFGGCTAITEPGRFYVTGSLKKHPSENKIRAFLEKHQLELYEATSNPPVDIGSIILIA